MKKQINMKKLAIKIIKWLVKCAVMAFVTYAVGLFLSVLVVAKIMEVYYGAVFSGIKQVTTPMLIGLWVMPAGFMVALLLFVTCYLLVKFCKWVCNI